MYMLLSPIIVHQTILCFEKWFILYVYKFLIDEWAPYTVQELSQTNKNMSLG